MLNIDKHVIYSGHTKSIKNLTEPRVSNVGNFSFEADEPFTYQRLTMAKKLQRL